MEWGGGGRKKRRDGREEGERATKPLYSKEIMFRKDSKVLSTYCTGEMTSNGN